MGHVPVGLGDPRAELRNLDVRSIAAELLAAAEHHEKSHGGSPLVLTLGAGYDGQSYRMDFIGGIEKSGDGPWKLVVLLEPDGY